MEVKKANIYGTLSVRQAPCCLILTALLGEQVQLIKSIGEENGA